MLYPVVDIGSNTVKMAIFDSDNEEQFTSVCFKSFPLHLINKRHKGCLSQSGINALCSAITAYVSLCELRGISDRMRLFATAPLRGIRNSKSVLKTVKEITGKEIRILSPHEEARYSFLGVSAVEGVTSGLVVDMGGGSTEFLSFSDGKEENLHSFQFGCISLTEKLYTYGIANFQNYINRKLKSQTFIKNNRYPLFLTGGSARSMIAAKKLMYGGDNCVEYTQLYTLISDIENADKAAREQLQALIGDREEYLPSVVFALYCTLCVTDCPTALVSSGGPREGFVWKWMKEEGVLKEPQNND